MSRYFAISRPDGMTRKFRHCLLTACLSATAMVVIAIPAESRVNYDLNAAASSEPASRPKCNIDVLHSMGSIVELSVNCGVNTAIISYSVIESLYCTPQLECFDSIRPIIAKYSIARRRLCGACRSKIGNDE